MNNSIKLLGSLAILFAIIFYSCHSKKSTGPFFGNGFHNGWADQTSIVIWTRLTKTPELNQTGEKFLVPSAEKAKKLSEKADKKKILKAQIPEGFTLDQMEGACLGAPGEVKLVYFPFQKPEQKIETEWAVVETDKNFTRQWKLQNLVPGTKYVVQLFARKIAGPHISDSIKGTFRTPPAADISEDLNFCIVTCHDYPRRDDPVNGHKIYPVMLSMFPDFYVHTGDVEYYDKPGPYALTEELMRFKWDRLFALPFQRTFFTQVTTYFMKDDHDALTNDAYPGMSYGTVSFERGLDIFDKEQFPSNDKPYKTIRWGKDLQIWMVEGRNYRSPNNAEDGPGKTIWGREQKDWLFKTLKESDATFKLLISPGPILGPDRKNKKDNYSNSNFKFEGDEIRNYLNQFDNLYICNGDRHWQYVTHFEGTNLWEFGCGPGSDSHAEGWPPDDKRPEHRFLRVKGGFLKGNISQKDGTPILTFQHFDVDGNVVHEEIFQSKLTIVK
jgi:alkaline phosphatase D